MHDFVNAFFAESICGWLFVLGAFAVIGAYMLGEADRRLAGKPKRKRVCHPPPTDLDDEREMDEMLAMGILDDLFDDDR
jgi:hypothetical protein